MIIFFKEALNMIEKTAACKDIKMHRINLAPIFGKGSYG